MYLTTSIQPVNVVYISQHNTSYILPALANRVKYSKEGRNLRITLNNARESDSNIYQCIKYVKNKEHHKKLIGKTTIVVVKGKTSGVVEQSPLYVNPQQGQSVSITCALKSSHEEEEISLLTSTFANRLEYSKQENKIVITLHNLQKNDSDIYVCAGMVKNLSFLLVNSRGTMMLIKEADQTYCSSWVLYSLITVVALLFSALICCTMYHVNMKKYFHKRKPNAVYEDMSYSSRLNTLIRNVYSTGD
ncbi:putative LOC102092411 [Columba livia]|uniref:Putative LOC102092411 n=1 Tax=Columba livia TaxID=8932 RepID=A0A2I0M7L7_COLLI|nr:putative LOC102092411 [Columba livia]